jgi:hypothetical protein
MSRPTAMVNQIADGLVKYLTSHRDDNPDQWYDPPVTIERGIGASADDRPKPALFVTSVVGEPIAPQQPGSGASHWRARAAIHVWGVVEGGDERERVIEELAADVRRAIASNLQLADVEGSTPILESGRFIIGDCTRDVEISEGGTGKAWFLQRLEAEFQWDSDAP